MVVLVFLAIIRLAMLMMLNVHDDGLHDDVDDLRSDFVGRPSPATS